MAIGEIVGPCSGGSFNWAKTVRTCVSFITLFVS